MNLLILPGNSPRHKQWLRDAQKALTPFFDEIRILDYKHWGTGEEKTDVKYEVDEVQKLVEGWGEYVVLAKSIGTIVATIASHEGKLAASSYVFLGLPLTLIKEDKQLPKYIQVLPHLTIIQNSADPFGSATEVREYSTTHDANVTVIERPGNTHDYIDFAVYSPILRPTLTN